MTTQTIFFTQTMGRESNYKKKSSNEEEQYRFAPHPTTTKGESSGGYRKPPRAREILPPRDKEVLPPPPPRDKEVLPPAPPLPNHLKPRRYIETSPTPSPPRHTDPPAGIMLALPAAAKTKTGTDQVPTVQPTHEDAPPASHDGRSEDAETVTLSDLEKVRPSCQISNSFFYVCILCSNLSPTCIGRLVFRFQLFNSIGNGRF